MEKINQWLAAFYQDCNFKLSFKTLGKEYYRERFEFQNTTALPVVIPDFFYKGVNLKNLEGEFAENYIELNIDNAGYKQPHDYLLTSITLVQNKVILAFTSQFSNWGVKRNVVIDPETNKVLRNDFKDVYNLSWKDYKEGEYQKCKQRTAPTFKRRNLD